jgi:hypothetical protein
MTVEVGISKGIRELGSNKFKNEPGYGKNLPISGDFVDLFEIKNSKILPMFFSKIIGR